MVPATTSKPTQPSTFSAFFPPSPPFTSLPMPIIGRVVIITGAASGMGHDLAKMLYHAGATVYIGARSESRCAGAKAAILASANPNPKHCTATGAGKIENMVMDLADLDSVRSAVKEFLGRETRLDLLVHNAAVMIPPKGSVNSVGRDLTLATNTLAPYVLTALLSPILVSTAATSPVDSVRVVFVVSLLQVSTPEDVMVFDEKTGEPAVRESPFHNYAQSKFGCSWMAVEFGRRLKGVVCVSLHPGIVPTDLQRHFPAPARALVKLLSKPSIYATYSELYASFSPEVTSADTGAYLMAWGRKGILPADGLKGMKDGRMERFWKWCEKAGGVVI